MKSLSLLSTGSVCFALACSTAATPPSGGAAGAGNSGPTAGAGNAAGASNAAGAGNAGAGNVAGAEATGGGATGSGGDPGSGGGTVAGAGGAPVTAGAGGAPVTAGAGGGSAAGGGAINPTDFSNGFDGALLQFPCGSGSPSFDCNQPAPCTGVSASQQIAPLIKPSGGAASSWTVKGTAGVTYDVKVHIQGVVESSWYHGGTRSAGTSSVDVGSTVPGAPAYAKDLFQTGGAPLTYADQGNGFDYNQYELDVKPPTGTTTVYFLNAVIPEENPHTSGKTQHLSFEIDELPTLKVPGGSTISLTVRDSNCVQIQNCGTSNNANCQQGARNNPFTGADPAAPASWTGKVTSGNGNTLGGQVVHFDVISVTAAQ